MSAQPLRREVRRRGQPGADRGRERGPPHARAGLEEAARQRAGGDGVHLCCVQRDASKAPSRLQQTKTTRRI